MLKTLLVVAFGVSLAGAAHAACNAGPTAAYDYFNRSASPKVEESGITCQDIINNEVYYEDNYGDPGTASRSSMLWSWQGFGCNAQGSGLPLGYAAKKLTISGCPSGRLCKTGGDLGCIQY